MFLPRRKILEAYAKETGTYLLRCYSKYHREINTWRAAEESFWLTEMHVGGCAQARSPSAHLGSVPSAQLMTTLLPRFHHHPPPFRTAGDAQPDKGSFGQLPGRITSGASPGDTIQLLHLLSVPQLLHLPTPRHSGSKRRLHPLCPGFSFKHILSLINSFEAFCIYYLLASGTPLPHPLSGGRVITSGKQHLCYDLFLTHCRLEVGRGW